MFRKQYTYIYKAMNKTSVNISYILLIIRMLRRCNGDMQIPVGWSGEENQLQCNLITVTVNVKVYMNLHDHIPVDCKDQLIIVREKM